VWTVGLTVEIKLKQYTPHQQFCRSSIQARSLGQDEKSSSFEKSNMLESEITARTANVEH